MIKSVFSASLLQSSVSHDLQKSCEFGAQEIFLIIINVENKCAAEFFCGKRDALCFSGLFDE